MSNDLFLKKIEDELEKVESGRKTDKNCIMEIDLWQSNKKIVSHLPRKQAKKIYYENLKKLENLKQDFHISLMCLPPKILYLSRGRYLGHENRN